jgi:phenylacetate-CoA ligase
MVPARTDESRGRMGDYKRLRERHTAHAIALAPALIERLDWSADRLADHRAARLRNLVRMAIERSPWHRKRLAELNTEVLDEPTLSALPVMTRDDLMAHFDEIVTDPLLRLNLAEGHLEALPTAGYLLDQYTVIASSGSTGRRGVFVYDWDGWAIYYLGLFRNLLRAVRSDPHLSRTHPVLLATVSASHPTHATAAYGRTFQGPHLSSRRLPVTMPVAQLVAGLNEAQPAFLHGYSSALHMLTREANAGRLRIRPKRIMAAAEPLLPEMRDALEATWGVRVGNWWGTSEGGGTGIPCDLAETHLSEDLLIVEPVDEEGRAVPPGQCSAKLFITNLYNKTLPLIRYEVTDEVTILEEACPCGSAHRRIADIQGRLDDSFVYQGVTVHPHVFRSRLGREREVIEYQVCQTERGAAVAIRCVGGPIDVQRLEADLINDLVLVGVREPDVKITTVDFLERAIGGKLKRFVPRR